MNTKAIILIPILTCCVCASTVVFTQSISESELLQDLAGYRGQIEEIEGNYGRYDLQLVEPLTRMADATLSLDQFDETHNFLDRAVQIYRVNEGLYTESQLPLLLRMVENSSRRGEWQQANNTLEHLLWLYTNKHLGFDSDLVYELKQLSDLHLEAVVGDDLALQPFHFRKAVEISRIAIAVGESLWGPNDVRLVELYYYLTIQFYLQTFAMENGGRTAYELREVMPGSGWVRPKKAVKRTLYRSGRRLIARMREVYEATDPPNPEAVAMTDLYGADWELIYSGRNAEPAYAKAYKDLLESGVAIETLHHFFERPTLLPISRFHSSVDQAMLANQQELQAPTGPSTDTDTVYFSEWSNAFPNVQYPLERIPFLSDEPEAWNVATFSFDLEAMSSVNRWVNGRYVRKISVPQGIEILLQTPEFGIELDELKNKIHTLNFRPRFQQGIAQSSAGTMHYRYLAD